MENKNYPGSYYQPLFDLLHQEHGITPLESEMTEIIFVVEKMRGKQPGPRWVNVSKRLPENDMHMDYPREYCLMCKCDGSRGAVEYKQGNFSEIQDLWQNGPYDVIWWLDERSNANHSTPAGREEDAVLGILQYISESEFYYNHAEKAWLIKGTHSIKLTHNELIEKYELFIQQKEAK